MYRFTVRRHLSKGEHYGWWQIRECISKSKQGKVIEYVDPSSCSIIFKNCYLYNRKGTAKKIFEGAYKAPCAWICCEEYEFADVIKEENLSLPEELKYNPKENPFWKCIKSNVDDKISQFIYSIGTKLYV